MEFGSGDSWGHPLVVCEQSQEGLPAHVAVVSVSPVCVHELYGFPEDIFTLEKTEVNVSIYAMIESMFVCDIMWKHVRLKSFRFFGQNMFFATGRFRNIIYCEYC